MGVLGGFGCTRYLHWTNSTSWLFVMFTLCVCAWMQLANEQRETLDFFSAFACHCRRRHSFIPSPRDPISHDRKTYRTAIVHLEKCTRDKLNIAPAHCSPLEHLLCAISSILMENLSGENRILCCAHTISSVYFCFCLFGQFILVVTFSLRLWFSLHRPTGFSCRHHRWYKKRRLMEKKFYSPCRYVDVRKSSLLFLS